MNQSLQWFSRTAVKELILWVGTITIATLIITGVSFYNHTTSAKLRSLMDQAELTADDVSDGRLDAIWQQRSALLTHVRADEWQTIISSAKAEMEEDSNK